MSIWSSINCPTVICSPTVCYFSREKPLVKPTAPVSLSHIFAFAIYFFLAFIFRSIKPKIPCCILFLLILFGVRSINLLQIYLTSVLHILRRRTAEGIDNPFSTSGCEKFLFVCRWCLHCVAWFSYWFDNLGFISEGNTYRRCVASSLPLWGNTDVASSDIKRNFWRHCRGGSSTYTRFLITSLISSQFTLFSICLSFSSPPVHKNLPFYSPSFSFAVFLSDLFSSSILLRSHHGSREHQVVWFLKYQQQWFY